MKAVLTIAGSDSSGGAGVQADLKTIAAHHLFGMSAITALTAQNTTGVFGIEEVSPAFVKQQIDVVFDDIRPDAVKIGMISSPQIVRIVADTLATVSASHIVVDPVMVATSGSTLIADEAVSVLVEYLFPLAEIITPNIPEAEVLSNMSIKSEDDMVAAAHNIASLLKSYCERPPAILVKGGHGINAAQSCDDVLRLNDGSISWLRGSRIDTTNTHGTGCTLSSAIACGLAFGLGVKGSCRSAKEYVAGALSAGLNLGQGSGPLDHMWEYN